MKKIFSLAVAVVLTICMTTSVLAAPLSTDINFAATANETASNNNLFALNDGLARFPQKKVNIVIGKKLKVGALAYNKKGRKVKLTYKSSNTKIATVNKSNGTITAKKTGTAKITVTGKGIKKSVLTVGVISKAVRVTNFRVTNWSGHSIFIGESKAMNVVVTPSNATNATVKYKSYSPGVATVSAAGVIIGVSTGTAEIVVRCGSIYKEYEISVGKRPTMLGSVIYSKNGITVTADEMIFSAGDDNYELESEEQLWYTVTNNSNSDIEISFENVTVNGYSLDEYDWSWDYPRIRVEANSVESDHFVIIREDHLSSFAIREIETIGFCLAIVDNYTRQQIDFAGPFILNV